MEVAGRITEMNIEDLNEDVVLCIPCQRGNKAVGANGVCRNCDEYMCHTCFGHHLKAKTCLNHVLVEISQYTKLNTKQDVEICVKHEDEKVKFFCRKHEEVGCGDCMILEHNTCKPEYIKELSKDFRNNETYKEIKLKLNGLDIDSNSELELVETHRKDNATLLGQALEDIKKIRIDVNQYLDKAEDKVIAESRKLNSANVTQLEKTEEMIKSLQTDINELQQIMCEDVQSDAVLFIHSIQCKSKLGEVEKSLETAKSDNSITQFKFKADETLVRLVSTEQQLGYFETVSPNVAQKNSKMSSGQAGKKWKKSDLKSSMFRPGVRVRRGPDWQSGNEDGNGLGTVTRVFADYSIHVAWDHSDFKEHGCYAGFQGLFSVEPA